MIDTRMDTRERLNKAFRSLRKRGYFARMNFTCCQTCGWAEVPEAKKNMAVFYHQQDAATLRDKDECYLAWSGNGGEIVSILKEWGLKVEWNGEEGTRIKVS